MKSYCYFQPIDDPQFDEHYELVKLWTVSWLKQGWEPTVLNQMHAEMHPAWSWYSAKVRGVPTLNKAEYEWQCYIRWLALAKMMRPGEVAVFGDYDMANLGFTPTDAMRIACPGRPVNTDINFGMGPFVLSYDQAQAIPPMMIAVLSLLRTYQNPQGHHWADMETWKAQQHGNIDWQVTHPICHEFAPDVKAPLVHVTYSSTHRHGFKTKLDAWKQLEARHAA